ncbi:MAG: hypothetical protein VYE77_00935 [Planctomycetota bacterium]|nr:hypothetical protein [Planctomycetota bacterium]
MTSTAAEVSARAPLWVPPGHTYETIFEPVLFDPMCLARTQFLRACGGQAHAETLRRRFEALPPAEARPHGCWLPSVPPPPAESEDLLRG